MKTNQKRKLAVKMQTEEERGSKKSPYSSVAWQERKNTRALKVRKTEEK